MIIGGVGDIFVADGTVRHCIAPLGTTLSQSAHAPEQHPDLFRPWVRFVQPSVYEMVVRTVPALTIETKNLLQVAGLSNRQLAALVGTTHPTIASILRGWEPVRVEGLSDTLLQVHSVVQRILSLAGGDKSLVRLALHATDSDGVGVLRHLKEKNYSRAYLAALDFVNQHKEISHPGRRQRRRPSSETVILHDADDG